MYWRYSNAHYYTSTCMHKPTSYRAIPFLSVIIHDCAMHPNTEILWPTIHDPRDNNALVLSNLYEYRHMSHIAITRFFGLQFCCRQYGSTFNPFDVTGCQRYQIRWNNTKIAITPFKVTNFGTNWKPKCDFLLVMNTILHPILDRFQVIADYWSNFRFRQGGAYL